jgi:hypothetical protein
MARQAASSGPAIASLATRGCAAGTVEDLTPEPPPGQKWRTGLRRCQDVNTSGRRRRWILAGLALGLGAAVLGYRGPGQGLVRGYLGDVAATMLVYALLGLVAAAAWSPRWIWWTTRWLAPAWARAAATLLIATGLELGQAGLWRQVGLDGVVLGTTVDPYDLLAYGIGVAVAWAWDGARADVISA